MAWLKTKSAARYLDISPRTLRNIVSSGEIKPAIVRGIYFFDVESLDLFMKSHIGDVGLNSLVDEVVKEMKI